MQVQSVHLFQIMFGHAITLKKCCSQRKRGEKVTLQYVAIREEVLEISGVFWPMRIIRK